MAILTRRLGLLLWCAAVLGACGEDSSNGGTEPDPAVAPFVGDWNATDFTVTSAANAQLVEDLINLGATFDLNVQPSGRYTATLVFVGQPSVEIGDLLVSGNTVTLMRSVPSPQTAVSTFTFVGADVLILDGPTDYDFNSDGVPEDATAHIELERVGS